MRLIDRYLLRQLMGPVVLATLALTAVALLSQSLAGLDLIVNQRQSALVFLKVTLLYMPQLINLILPVAVFVAALVGLNRLHTEQEIVVCFASGMSRWRVISPAMRLAGAVAFLALLMNLFIQPLTYKAMRQEMFNVKADLAATLVREGEFTEPTPGLTVYAQSVDGRGNLRNLFIHQIKSDGSTTTYTAEEGHVGHANGRPVLVMLNGSNQEFSSRGVLNYITFDYYTFDLAPLANTQELVNYKPSDRSLHELFFPDLQQDWERRNRLDMLAETCLATLLQKGVSGDAAALPVHRALEMATLNAATALGWENEIGSIVAGKAADLTAIDLSSIETQPVYDPVSHLFHAASREHVSHVWVGGELLLDNRALTRLDADELKAKAAMWQQRFEEH